RMDFNLPEVPPGFTQRVEEACTLEIAADRRIDGKILPRDEAFEIPDIIRTATNLLPPDLQEVRIVGSVGLAPRPDGGTHVAPTRQIGRLRVVKGENKGRGFRRLRVQIADCPPVPLPYAARRPTRSALAQPAVPSADRTAAPRRRGAFR